MSLIWNNQITFLASLLALFQGKPEGRALFFRPAALSFAHIAQLHRAHSALPDEKITPAGLIGLVLTGPRLLLMSKGNHHRWLHGEIVTWIKDGLITPDQAQQLQQRYPLIKGVSWGRIVLSSIGAILFGLGVILLFAYNWEVMPKVAKLAVVFGALAAAHIAGALVNNKQQNPIAGEGLHALGTMLFGAGIWLVAQIYHIDEHYPNAFILWGLGALLLAWALPSLTQALMAVALVIVWQLTEVFDFRHELHSAPWFILLGVFPLIWCLRSAVLAGAATTALIMTLTVSAFRVDDDLFIIVIIFTSAFFVAIGRLVELYPRFGLENTGYAFRLPALIAFFIMLYLLSFPDLAGDFLDLSLAKPWTKAYFFGTLVPTLAAWGLLLPNQLKAGLGDSATDLVIAASLLLILIFLSLDIGGDNWMLAAPFNLLLLAQSLWLINDGSRKVNARQVVAGCLLLSLLAMSRYLDLFDSLISRALVFFLVGGGLFLVGNFYNRRKQQDEGVA